MGLGVAIIGQMLLLKEPPVKFIFVRFGLPDGGRWEENENYPHEACVRKWGVLLTILGFALQFIGLIIP
jgi:hypothetical protein